MTENDFEVDGADFGIFTTYHHWQHETDIRDDKITVGGVLAVEEIMLLHLGTRVLD